MVATEADRRVESAKQHMFDATKDLAALFVDHCEGWGDWNADYTNILYETFNTLLMLQNKLK